MKKKNASIQVVLLLIAAALVYGWREWSGRDGGGSTAAPPLPTPASTSDAGASRADATTAGAPIPSTGRDGTARDDTALIVRLYRERTSDTLVEAPGTVDRELPDDTIDSRHQRFIVRLANGHTVLISHNIDLAPRVPLGKGDAVRFHGEYEWNERGGVVHWTHHDPRGRREGGWIEHDGVRYE